MVDGIEKVHRHRRHVVIASAGHGAPAVGDGVVDISPAVVVTAARDGPLASDHRRGGTGGVARAAADDSTHDIPTDLVADEPADDVRRAGRGFPPKGAEMIHLRFEQVIVRDSEELRARRGAGVAAQ